MNILVIGSGGREHAIAHQCLLSPQVNQVFVAPGNAGTATESGITNVTVDTNNNQELLDCAQQNNIDLTIVGPEVPLANGVVDRFRTAGLLIVGPSQACAQLEASKAFSKAFMKQHQIPTAAYEIFNDQQLALDFLQQANYPLVLKADGLAAGKGVVIATTRSEAESVLPTLFAINQQVVIEDFLDGVEFSYMVITDGTTIIPLASARDHKSRDEDGLGPNTGGMGAYSPSPLVTDTIEQQVLDDVIQPVINAFAQQGTPYTGFLYAGMMLTKTGIKTLEFNCRLGDPETQVILPRLHSDFVSLCCACAHQQLNNYTIAWKKQTCLGVVLASRHYPEAYLKGEVISGLDNLPSDCKAYHAGTKLNMDNQLVTNGGRVLCITTLDPDLAAGRQRIYSAIKKISWPSCFYRSDI